MHVDTVMNDRVIGLSIDELRKIPCVIAIASENTKALAILGALRTGRSILSRPAPSTSAPFLICHSNPVAKKGLTASG
ncbi:Transcriptional regulator, contains sigma factor-related N-terminal domain [Serratia fonticola]|uniref:Transcriptional regulator, contains sigma factor-related N-terminal domain n=1 Tax=Serratia fonticola TaxID=47917 RepID=A0A4U9WD41_SERFO|nr:Transcriptional regulator, contains sigma factor-related N-terminal domain [Serratia fonticola]